MKTKSKQIDSLNKEIDRLKQKLLVANHAEATARELSDNYRRQRDDFFEKLQKNDELLTAYSAELKKKDELLRSYANLLDSVLAELQNIKSKLADAVVRFGADSADKTEKDGGDNACKGDNIGSINQTDTVEPDKVGEVHIKSEELCESCLYDRCTGDCEFCILNTRNYSCYCLNIDDGEPCKRYKPKGVE